MKTCLVLEGGALRGLYTCGVLDYFLDNNIDVDLYLTFDENGYQIFEVNLTIKGED